VRALPGKRYCLVRHNPSLPLTAQQFQRSTTEHPFPEHARNLNTGENRLTGTVHRKAKVAVHRSAEFPSFVEFSSVTGVDRQ
jgi:hypothetical protein